MPIRHKYMDNIQRHFQVSFKVITLFDAAWCNFDPQNFQSPVWQSFSIIGRLNLPNPLPDKSDHSTWRARKREPIMASIGTMPQWTIVWRQHPSGSIGTAPVGGQGAKPSWGWSCKLLSIWASKGDGKIEIAKFSVSCKFSSTDECCYDTLNSCFVEIAFTARPIGHMG